MAEINYLIPKPSVENAVNTGYKGTLIYSETDYRRNYYVLQQDTENAWWAIGMVAKVGRYDHPIIVSDQKKNVHTICDGGGGQSTAEYEMTYDGVKYYVSGYTPYATDTVSGSRLKNNIIPYYNESTFSDTEAGYKLAGQKLLDLYKNAGGSFPGDDVKYPTAWIRKQIDGNYQKSFTYAHAKTVYTDFANKKTLADKLSEIDTEIGNKAESSEIPTKVSQLNNDSNYQTETQVKSTVSDEMAKIVADAPESFDTLKEISDWISGHENDASAMNSAIKDNKSAITTLQNDKANKTEIPNELPANGGNSATVNGHTVNADVPENAVFTDTVYDDTKVQKSISQQSTEMMDIKMLGWSVPREYPVQNQVNGNQFIQKVGRVDSSTLDWSYQTENTRFIASIPSDMKQTTGTRVANIMYLYGYKTISDGSDFGSISNKSIYISNNMLVIHDSDYTDASAFKSAMQGRYLYYELATPITITIDGNEIGETVSDVRKETTVNLLNPTLQTDIKKGIRCTNNGDGTYTISGTSKAQVTFGLAVNVKFPTGCILTGCKGGSPTTYMLGLFDGANYFEVYDIDNAKEIPANTYRYAYIVVRNGVTIPDNTIIKPMITTNLDATYDDFVPYTGDTGSINGDVADLRNNVNGINKIIFSKSITISSANTDYFLTMLEIGLYYLQAVSSISGTTYAISHIATVAIGNGMPVIQLDDKTGPMMKFVSMTNPNAPNVNGLGIYSLGAPVTADITIIKII